MCPLALKLPVETVNLKGAESGEVSAPRRLTQRKRSWAHNGDDRSLAFQSLVPRKGRMLKVFRRSELKKTVADAESHAACACDVRRV